VSDENLLADTVREVCRARAAAAPAAAAVSRSSVGLQYWSAGTEIRYLSRALKKRVR
jgi:hypothetical protein